MKLSGWRQTPAHLRFWRREYARRLRKRVANWPSPALNAHIMRSLELRAGRWYGLDLTVTSDRTREVLRQTTVLAPAVRVTIPERSGQYEVDDFLYAPITVRRLVNVELDVNSGLLFSRDWVIAESGTGHRVAMDHGLITGATVRVRDGGITSERRAISPLTGGGEHYHSIMEVLPQVMRILEVAPHVTFITSAEQSDLFRRILGSVGARYEVVPVNTVLHCDEVWFSAGFPFCRTHPADMELIRETLMPSGPLRNGYSDRVYISRARSARPIVDEDRVHGYLSTRGFDILFLEELPFEEQVARLNNARLVVAPHGAGLLNTLFMEPGGRVVEIATADWWVPAFRRIAHHQGHDYELVMIPSSSATLWGHADDVIAALEELL